MSQGNRNRSVCSALRWMLLAASIVLIALTLAACDAPTLEQEVSYLQTAPGVPLDAIQYRSPTFADGSYSWRVTDRQSGAQWWLIWMDTGRNAGQWLVLPIAAGQKGAA